MSNPNFQAVGAPNYASPLVDFSGLNPNAKKQQASTGTQQQPNAGQNLGAALGKWLQQYQQTIQKINPNLPPPGGGAAAQPGGPVNPFNTAGGAIY